MGNLFCSPRRLSKQLHKAAKNNDVRRLTKLLKKGAEVDARDCNGVTALMMAASEGYTLCVLALLDAGAEYNLRDYFQKSTALHMAAAGRHNIVVMALTHLPHIALEVKNELGHTSLHVAAGAGVVDSVRSILRVCSMAVVNSQDRAGLTPLMVATMRNHAGIVELLLLHATEDTHRVYGLTSQIRSRTAARNILKPAPESQRLNSSIHRREGADMHLYDSMGRTAEALGLIHGSDKCVNRLVRRQWRAFIPAWGKESDSEEFPHFDQTSLKVSL